MCGLSICAIIAARNEYHYLKVLIPYLAAQEIDIVIIDNDSTDQSHVLYRRYQNNPIIRLINIPFSGTFSLSLQLETKKKVIGTLHHDWIIHHDADEIMEHREQNLTLRNAIEEAHNLNYNVLNLDEFVFLPPPDFEYTNSNYYEEFLRYYFFEPVTNRLNRIWKRDINAYSLATGGHRLSGEDLSIMPTNHILRHYIALDQEHLYNKYLNRTYDKEDSDKGWHGNRRNFTSRNLVIPSAGPAIKRLRSPDSKDFQKDKLCTKHFWQW